MMTSDVSRDLGALAQALRASTVRVHDERRQGSGSGVVWSADGLILTNAHVVRGGSAQIEWEDGRRVRAELVRRDDERDLAALRIAPQHGLTPAPVRASASVVPGELVVAVGNPLGLTGAMTTGLVQRCNTRWVVADVRLEPGNSGGPLADAAGRVVGINSMVAGRLALAVPSDAVATFLGSGATRGRLGVSLVPVLVAIGGRREPALLVTAVEAGSLAERAGVRLGDAIVASDRGQARDLERFAESLARAASLEVLRGGTRVTLTVPAAPREEMRAA
jgi:serine protease Do